MLEVSAVVGLICLITGGVVICLGLIWLGMWFLWGIIEITKRGKRLHAYIKDHKREFLAWGDKYNKMKG